MALTDSGESALFKVVRHYSYDHRVGHRYHHAEGVQAVVLPLGDLLSFPCLSVCLEAPSNQQQTKPPQDAQAEEFARDEERKLSTRPSQPPDARPTAHTLATPATSAKRTAARSARMPLLSARAGSPPPPSGPAQPETPLPKQA